MQVHWKYKNPVVHLFILLLRKFINLTLIHTNHQDSAKLWDSMKTSLKTINTAISILPHVFFFFFSHFINYACCAYICTICNNCYTIQLYSSNNSFCGIALFRSRKIRGKLNIMYFTYQLHTPVQQCHEFSRFQNPGFDELRHYFSLTLFVN